MPDVKGKAGAHSGSAQTKTIEVSTRGRVSPAILEIVRVQLLLWWQPCRGTPGAHVGWVKHYFSSLALRCTPVSLEAPRDSNRLSANFKPQGASPCSPLFQSPPLRQASPPCSYQGGLRDAAGLEEVEETAVLWWLSRFVSSRKPELDLSIPETRRRGRRYAGLPDPVKRWKVSPVNTWVGGALERGHLSPLFHHLGFSLLLDSTPPGIRKRNVFLVETWVVRYLINQVMTAVEIFP